MSNWSSSAPAFGHRRLILLTCAVALGAYHIFATTVMYPVPGGDAVVFMPAAINLKAGRGLSNFLWTGRYRFVEHPPVFQMVVSACMGKSETRNAFVVLAILNSLTLTLYAAILCTGTFTRKLIASPAGFIVLAASLFAMAFLTFNASGGRPETLSTLVLALAIAAVTWLPRKYWPVYLGIAIGVTAGIHPTHGIFIACLVVITFLLTAPVSQAIRKMLLAAAIALPLFWILLSLGPYPVEEVLRTLSWHASLATGPDYRLSTLALYYLKLAPWSGVYLLGLLLVLVWCGVHFWRGTGDRMTRWARLAALFLVAFVFWYFSIRRPNASYYLIMLAPALAVGALYLFDARAGNTDRLSGVPLMILAAFCSIFSLFLARDMALFVDYRTDGVSFAEARRDFDRLVRSTDQMISVSESLWVLTDEFDRISVVERGTTSGDLMVLQQTQRGALSPPVIPGYRLVSQRFILHSPKWFGWPIARTTPGYSFAVFAREGSLEENRPNHEG